MRDEMSATAARCFDQPAAMMDQIAQVILKASTPPSQANN
jgi:hypothetical protein